MRIGWGKVSENHASETKAVSVGLMETSEFVNTKVFGLNNWKNRVAEIVKTIKDYQKLSLSMCFLRCLLASTWRH